MGLFGGGNSKSSSTSSTVNQDNRSVADAQGQSLTAGAVGARDNGVVNNIQVTGGGKKATTIANINVTNTDYGAIDKAFEFAEASGEQNAQSIKDVLGVAEGVFGETTKAFEKAYQDAKGGTLQLQQIAIGSLVALGAVVYFVTKGRT